MRCSNAYAILNWRDGDGEALTGFAQAVASTARTSWRTLDKGLRLGGRPGTLAATWLQRKVRSSRARLAGPIATTRSFISLVLTPSGILVPAIRSLAQAKALSSFLRRAVPGRWGIAVRLIATFLSLPAWLRIEAYKLFVRPGAAVSPEDDPTPPAVVVDLERVRDEAEPRVVGSTHPARQQQYPARRSSSKKRR